MKKLILSILCVVASTSYAQQSNINTQVIGNTIYQNGTINGQYYNSTTTQYGNTVNETINYGGRTINCTTQTYGNQQSRNCY